MKKTMSEKTFQIVDWFVMFFIIAVVVFPLMHIFAISVSDRVAVSTLKVGLFPVGFNLDAYAEILKNPVFIRSLGNTLFITVVGTVFSVLINAVAAYVMSKDYFYGKKFVTYYFVITMYFSGGLIPSYLLVSRYLHLNNTYWAYLLPYMINVFYIIVMKSQIEAVPSSLKEAAMIDGASEYRVLFNIVIPIIMPTIAAVSMFIALGTWNMWFPSLLYTTRDDMWTLQYFLRAVVFDKFFSNYADNVVIVPGSDTIPPQNYQMAAIILVALPIVAIYPFVQKYFVKGILVGSVKE